MPGGLEHPPDDDAYRPPLPPQDRVWRHPSEFASGESADASTTVTTTRTPFRAVLTIGATAALVVIAVVLVGGALELSDDPSSSSGQVARLTSSSLHATTFVPTTLAAVTTTPAPTPKVRLGIAGIDTAFGVRLTECTVGGAAAAAGLKAGDVLVSVDRETVRRMVEVTTALADVTPDRPLTVGVMRDGVMLVLDVPLASRP